MFIKVYVSEMIFRTLVLEKKNFTALLKPDDHCEMEINVPIDWVYRHDNPHVVKVITTF